MCSDTSEYKHRLVFKRSAENAKADFFFLQTTGEHVQRGTRGGEYVLFAAFSLLASKLSIHSKTDGAAPSALWVVEIRVEGLAILRVRKIAEADLPAQH